MTAEEMYQEMILDWYRNPKNYGTLKDAKIKSKDFNPLCGDEIEMHIDVGEDNRVKEIRFSGKGCIISQVSASMLTEEVKGKSLEEAAAMSKEKVLEKLEIPISATRMKCALLGLKVLKSGVYSHLGKIIEEKEAEVAWRS